MKKKLNTYAMKTMLFLAVLLCFTGMAQPQSRLWPVLPNYFKFTPTPGALIPLPQTFGGYAGQAAQYAHNAAHGANGELLFFVVDGAIYDKNGDLKEDLSAIFGARGSSEVIITPVPDQCDQWLVVIGDVDDVNAGAVAFVCYAVISITNQTTFSTLNTGTLVAPSNAANDAVELAVSPLRPEDNTRLLYVHVEGDIVKFRINSNVAATGPLNEGTVLHNISEGLPTQLRSEMELIRMADGKYRLAYPWYSNVAGSFGVSVLYLDAAGDYLSSDTKYLGSNGPNLKVPKGLEFSPNGQYLYATHSGTNPIQYWNLITNLVTNFAVPSAADFSQTQIERGFDNNLYFAGDNATGTFPRLAILQAPDNPSLANWVDNVNGNNINVPVAHNFVSIGLGVNVGIRMLPDQRDGEDYFSSFNTSMECCLSSTAFTTDNYTASGSHSQTWTSTNNPFGGTLSNPVSTVTVKNNLTIPATYTVTISGMTFKFAPRLNLPTPGTAGASTVINPGGRLILKNSTFTSYNDCGPGMWEGIEVQGTGTGNTASHSQFPFVTSPQGVLIVQNNSVIENAYFGALAATRLTPFPNLAFAPASGGGIIRGSNSIFRNNQIGVEFYLYNDYQNALHNFSNFTTCNFITNSATLNDPSVTFQVFVAMFGTQGINFVANNFENSRTIQNVFDIPVNGGGIFAFASAFQVLPQCHNFSCSNFTRNTFKRLGYGIQAWAPPGMHAVKVDKADFNANFRGIVLNNSNYATLTNNTFEVIKYPDQMSPGAAYGIYLNASAGYQVEQNQFAFATGLPNPPTSDATYGIIVNNSGPQPNLVYSNVFHQIYIGAQVQGINCDQQVMNPINDKGLQLRCNKFDPNATFLDIVEANGCMDYHQGFAFNNCTTCPANNEFSHPFQVNGTTDYYLDPLVLYSINYVHPNGGSFPTYKPNTIGNVTLTDNGTAPGCPATPVNCPYCRRAAIATDEQRLENLQAKIDNGKTSVLLAAIQGNVPSGQLKNALMNASPYLSDEVLIAYIKTGVPPGNLKDVLAANSPLRPDVLNAFNAIANGLPAGVRNAVAAAQSGTSPMDELLAQISGEQSDKRLQVDALIRDFLTDTIIVGGLDSVEAVLKKYGTTVDDETMYAATLVSAKQYDAATAVIENIRAGLGGFLNITCQLLEIQIRLEKSPDEYFSLKTASAYSADLTTITRMAAADKGDGFVGAQAIMKAVFNIPYPEVIIHVNPSSASGRLAAIPKMDEESAAEPGKIYPNPNNGNMYFNYDLPEGSKGVLLFYDVSGKPVSTIPVKTGRNVLQISEEKLENGIYFYRFVIDGIQVNSGKILIAK